MGVKYRATINFDGIKKSIQENQKLKLEKALEEAVTEIVQRTQKGLDVGGQSFKSYTKSYEIYKRKKRGGPLKPDLTFTGKMLAALTSKVKKLKEGVLEGKIYFLGSQVTKARANNSIRRFVGLSAKQISEITEKLKRK